MINELLKLHPQLLKLRYCNTVRIFRYRFSPSFNGIEKSNCRTGGKPGNYGETHPGILLTLGVAKWRSDGRRSLLKGEEYSPSKTTSTAYILQPFFMHFLAFFTNMKHKVISCLIPSITLSLWSSNSIPWVTQIILTMNYPFETVFSSSVGLKPIHSNN